MSDPGFRQRERSFLQSRDAESVLRFDAELRRSGQRNRYYSERLLEDFLREIQVDDTRGWEDVTGPPPEPWIEHGGRRLLVSPGLAAEILIPDSYGRLQGVILAAHVSSDQALSSLSNRSYSVRFSAALVTPDRVHGKPLTDPLRQFSWEGLHPFFWWYQNHNVWHPSRTSRTVGQSLTDIWIPARVADIHQSLAQLGSFEAFVTAASSVLEDLDASVGRAAAALSDTLRDTNGSLEPDAVQSFVRGAISPSFQAARRALMAAPAPDSWRIGGAFMGTSGMIGSSFRPWNMSGEAVSHMAVIALANQLPPTRFRPVVRQFTGNPYDTENHWQATARLEVVTRNTMQTPDPAVVRCAFDPLMGLWAGRENWLGNRLPPGGEWKVLIGGPRSVQELHHGIVQWIKKTFPESRVLVAIKETRRAGDYDWRPA